MIANTITIVVAAVITRDGRRLLQQRESPDRYAWCSPGGKVETGETYEEALLRELREELGVESQIGERLYVYAYQKRDRSSVEVHFYEAYIGEQTPAMKVGCGLGWFSEMEVEGLRLTPADTCFAAQYLKRAA